MADASPVDTPSQVGETPAVQQATTPKAPTVILSDMAEKDKAWLFLRTLYGMYEFCSDADLLRFEFRCVSQIWKGKVGEEARKGHNLRYFPLTEWGYSQGVDYIWTHRNDWEILNGILPRRDSTGLGRGLMSNEATPYFGVWGVDIDGKGEYGPTPGMTALQSASTHFKGAQKKKNIPAPHMAVEGRNGYHLYWFLDKPYALDYNGGNWLYKQNLERFGRWISGEPDCINTDRRPAYTGPHADTGQTYRAATLRPVGSFNHKARQPKAIELVRYNLEASPLLSRHKWTVDLLPPPIDPPSPDPNVTVVSRNNAIIGEWQRPPLTWRTIAFLNQGIMPGQGGFHAVMRTAVADLNHCNYSPEEAFGMIVMATTGDDQIEEVRELLFPQHGQRLRFQDGTGWNHTTIYPDKALDKDTPLEQIKLWLRGK